MRSWLRVAVAVARREILSSLLSPSSYQVAALFLVIQGYSFWLLCQALSASRAASSAGLAYFFGGTFLYWLVLLFAVALLTMRLFAEPRQRGALDQLLAVAAPEGALVCGKFVGALGFFIGLWLPTVGYLGLLASTLSPGSRLDGGAVVGGYLGTLLCGSSALALGLLASVLAPTALLSATLTFAAESLLLLGGLAGELAADRPLLRALLDYLNLFAQLDELSRGIVDSRRVVYHLSLVAVALTAATVALRTRPGDRQRWRRNGATGLLLLLLLGGVNWIASRYSQRIDLTRSSEYRLSPAFSQLLAERRPHKPPIQVTVLHSGRDEQFDRLQELLRRAAQQSSGWLHSDWVDPQRQPERSRLLADRLHLAPDDLQLGAVIVESGGRSQLVERSRLGEPSSDLVPATFAGEQALGTAILLVTADRTPTLCFTVGHGESEPDSQAGSGLSQLASALGQEGWRSRRLDRGSELTVIPADCDLLLIAGPARPFLAVETAAIASYLDGSGRLLLLSGALLDPGLQRFLDSGLEELLRHRGVRLANAVAIDPPQQLGDSLAFVVADTYGDHPATSGLRGRRTLWPLSRPVFPLAPLEPALENPAALPLPGGTGHSGLSWRAWVLATTTDQGYGETDLEALRTGQPHFDAQRDLGGPLPLAVAAQPRDPSHRARLVVIGSTQLAWNDSLVLWNRELLLGAVKWLAELPPGLAIAAKQPTELRLLLTAAQLRWIGVALVLGLPLLPLLLGALVRRRRHR